MAGVFYSYSTSVTLGLKMLPDAEYLAAMQSINKAIQNPVFFIAFLGALFLLPASTYMNFAKPPSTRFLLILAATIIYLAGVFA